MSGAVVALGVFFAIIGILHFVFCRRAAENIVRMNLKDPSLEVSKDSRQYRSALFSMIFSGVAVLAMGAGLVAAALTGKIH